MLTLNADAHPVFRRMHKLAPSLPKDAQDKRMVVVLEADEWSQWLEAKPEQGMIRRAPVSGFIAEPDRRISTRK